MHGRLYGLFVAHPDQFLSKEQTLHIETCARLCKELGGEFLRVEHHNLVEAIATVAKDYGITQVVIGETQRSRWRLLFQGSTVQALMRVLPAVDLHIIATHKSIHPESPGSPT